MPLRNRVCTAMVLIAVAAQMGCARLDPFAAERDYFRQNATLGMSEEDVRGKLGQPYLEYTRQSAPEDYYEKGWTYKKRAISNKVLIYLRGETICYVYIDVSGRVEETFIGGS